MAKNNCANEALYDSLEHCKGETVLPGLRPHVYYIPKSDIMAWPKRVDVEDDDATMRRLGTLTGDFILAADAYWHRIDLVSPQSNVNSESQGDEPSKTFNNTAAFRYPGLNADAVGFCRQANADDLVFLWPQRDGRYRVLGNEMFETNVTPTQESGSSETDSAGTTINVSVTDDMPSPYYEGIIDTLDDEGGGIPEGYVGVHVELDTDLQKPIKIVNTLPKYVRIGSSLDIDLTYTDGSYIDVGVQISDAGGDERWSIMSVAGTKLTRLRCLDVQDDVDMWITLGN